MYAGRQIYIEKKDTCTQSKETGHTISVHQKLKLTNSTVENAAVWSGHDRLESNAVANRHSQHLGPLVSNSLGYGNGTDPAGLITIHLCVSVCKTTTSLPISFSITIFQCDTIMAGKSLMYRAKQQIIREVSPSGKCFGPLNF